MVRRAQDLRLYVLGAPRIVWGDEPLLVTRRQVRALIYRLAVSPHPMTRDELCFLFWPDVPQNTARRNLTHLLTHLRRTLPDPSVVQVSRQHVGLDFQRVWVDAADFTRRVEGWRARDSIQALWEAVDLYGGTFLAGFSLPSGTEFDLWLSAERQRWERLYLEALRHLVEESTSRGMLDEAIRYARQYLRVDALAEEMHRRLMSLYVATGNRSAALRQFERCVTVLESELGVAPLPETRALYDSILAGRPAALGVPIPSERSHPVPGMNVPLVGREDALARLHHAYDRARSGNGMVVMISGEAGIGKSRLMDEFVRRVQGKVLSSGAQPGTRALPYYPIVQALRGALAASSPAARDHFARNLGPVWLAELSRLLPDLRSMYPDIPPPIQDAPEGVRPRLFEALARSIFSFAVGGHPVILSLDDLHWADSTTLEWLAYLAGRMRGRRLLVLSAYRPEEGNSLEDLFYHLRRMDRLLEIPLSGLLTAEILHVLRYALGRLPEDESLAQRLRRATGGNPFFLLETLRAVVESGHPIERMDLHHLPLPETVCQAVDARLSRLGPQARQVLEAGSVLEDGFTFDMVRLTAGREESETAAGLEELVDRRLLVARDGRYSFHHDLTRRAVEQGLNPVRRQLLHRRAARAVAAMYPNAAATEARHLDAGGDLSRAVEAYMRAASQAHALGAWREVEMYQNRSLALLDLLDPGRTSPEHLLRRGEILVERARVRFLQGRLLERDTDLSELEGLASASGSGPLKLLAFLARSHYLSLDGDYEGALSLAREGMRLAERLGDVTAQARLLARIGFAHYFRGDYTAAMEALRTALTLETEETAARGEVLSVLSYAYYLVADYSVSLEYRREALRIRRKLGLLAHVAEDLTDMGILSMRIGRLEDARHYLEEALSLARKTGSRPAESYALNNLGNLHYMLGDYPAALKHYRQSLVLQRATGSRRGESSSLGNSGMVHLALGDYERAEQLIRQSLSIDREIGYESGLAEGLSQLSRALMGKGEVEAALSVALRSLETARRIGDRYCQVLALNALAEIHLSRGEPRDALGRAREAAAVSAEIGSRDGLVLALTSETRSYLALGMVKEALAASERATDLLGEVGTLEGPVEMVYLVHSMALAAAGRRSEAAWALCRARSELRAKASHILAPDERKRFLSTFRRVWKGIARSVPHRL